MRGLAALTILTAAVVATSVLAQGCGPTRLKVAESVVLDAAPARVWALIGNFQDVSWNAENIAAKGAGGNTADKAVRTVTLKGGASFDESLFKYDADAMRYSYHIDRIDVTRLPAQNVSVTLEVVPQGDKSVVHWRSVFYRYLRPNEGAPDAADDRAKQAMKAYLRAGLDSLKAKVATEKSDAKT